MNQSRDEQPRTNTVVRKSITIGRSADDVYRAFADDGVLCLVDRPDAAESEVLEEKPGELLRWRWNEDGEERGQGRVTFRPAPGDRGTEVAVELGYDARGGAARRWVEKMLGAEPGQQLLRDLYRLRQLLETGEIASTVGQPAARETTGGVVVSAVRQPSGRAES